MTQPIFVEFCGKYVTEMKVMHKIYSFFKKKTLISIYSGIKLVLNLFDLCNIGINLLFEN